MRVAVIDTKQAFDSLHSCWNQLAGSIPFRRWEWLHTWWSEFGADRSLFVLQVRDHEDQPIGLAPWWVDDSTSGGRVVRFLGVGKACSDYLGLLCKPGFEQAVGETLARWLCDESSQEDHDHRQRPAWDLIHLEGVGEQEETLEPFLRAMQHHGGTLHCEESAGCWQVALPSCWDTYVASLSRSRRHYVRRAKRNHVDSGNVVLRQATDQDSCRQGMQVLIELHQKRRNSLGDDGCFSDPQFTRFLERAAERFLDVQQLQLQWAEMDGTPIAVEYNLIHGDAIYGYQAGMNPDYISYEPGRVMKVLSIGHAIELSVQQFDMLRGDEPYKKEWGAVRRPLYDLRIVPNRMTAQMRHKIWVAGTTMKDWLKASLRSDTPNS